MEGDGTPFGRYRLLEMLGQGGMGGVADGNPGRNIPIERQPDVGTIIAA